MFHVDGSNSDDLSINCEGFVIRLKEILHVEGSKFDDLSINCEGFVILLKEILNVEGSNSEDQSIAKVLCSIERDLSCRGVKFCRPLYQIAKVLLYY